jgi:hypothetical protein
LLGNLKEGMAWTCSSYGKIRSAWSFTTTTVKFHLQSTEVSDVTVIAKLGDCIRSKGLNIRQFKEISGDTDSENGNILY